MNSAPFEVRFAEPANIDFLGILNWTVERLGHAAADRYQALIGQTLIDLADDPSGRVHGSAKIWRLVFMPTTSSPAAIAWPVTSSKPPGIS